LSSAEFSEVVSPGVNLQTEAKKSGGGSFREEISHPYGGLPGVRTNILEALEKASWHSYLGKRDWFFGEWGCL